MSPIRLRNRQAARVAIVDPTDRVLLLCARDPSDPTVDEWWELPGGGLNPDEPAVDAARREAFEETGLTDLECSPVVWKRHVEFTFAGYEFDQYEQIFVARSGGGPVRPGGLEAVEVEAFQGWEWVPVASLGDFSGANVVYPGWLAEQLPRLLADGWPPEPIDMGEG